MHRTEHATLLLDRDGVINEEREGYVRNLSEFRFLPGAVEALATLSRAGYRLVVVTNQSMVGRALASLADVEALHAHMRREVARAGGFIADILVCPHAPQDNCSCRKPRPGLVLKARRRYGLRALSSYMVGDNITDVIAAISGGCRPILVNTGHGQDARAEVERRYGSMVTYLEALPQVSEFLASLTQKAISVPSL